ncbi:max dimerization protein 3 isoform X1 [Erinaceus europaeus]|uniref:Max dimerization protein 3 n=1 Tax=Erinaceus europaeus TaxID=9365 RepID=A0ABM3XWM4_ERIEU|nr:max dimerization protein 3 isoform X1 [Erinaceus europaeus]
MVRPRPPPPSVAAPPLGAHVRRQSRGPRAGRRGPESPRHRRGAPHPSRGPHEGRAWRARGRSGGAGEGGGRRAHSEGRSGGRGGGRGAAGGGAARCLLRRVSYIVTKWDPAPAPAPGLAPPAWSPWPETSRCCCRPPSSWSAARERPSTATRPCARTAAPARPTRHEGDLRRLASWTAGGLRTMSWRSVGESQPPGLPPLSCPTVVPLSSQAGWHCPPDPFPRRRAQLKRCLEQLKQQMPLGADCARYTTLSLLRRARVHIQQ